MRLLVVVIATIVAAMSLPVTPASASPSRSARKAKLAKRSRMDNAPMVVETGSARRTKRRADDPVLRRYGKRPEDLSYVDYKSKRAQKSVAEADDSGVMIIEEDKPAKKKSVRKVEAKPAKPKATKTKASKAKPTKASADEEILIIEESPAPKKLAKTKTRAKAKATLVDDDDDDDITITID